MGVKLVVVALRAHSCFTLIIRRRRCDIGNVLKLQNIFSYLLFFQKISAYHILASIFSFVLALKESKAEFLSRGYAD